MPVASGPEPLELHSSDQSPSESLSVRRAVLVKNANGLHLLPCSVIARAVKDFPGTVKLIRGNREANAKSIMDVIQLGAVCGTELILEVEGPGAAEVTDRIEMLFDDGFMTDR